MPNEIEDDSDDYIDVEKKKKVKRNLLLGELGENGGNVAEKVLNSGPKKNVRKRMRTPRLWEHNIKKVRRLKGEEYTNRGGKIVKEKSIGQPCKCRLKCFTKISEQNRTKIHDKFWSLNSWDQRKQFVRSSVKMCDIKRYRPRNNNQEGRRKFSYAHHFDVNNKFVEVCKVMFLNTLSLGEKFLRNSLKSNNSTIATPDKRQNHKPTRIIPQRAKDIAKRHIESFPTTQSHYTRRDSRRRYLEPGLNVKIMYNLYRQYCQENKVDPQDIIKESYYRFIFVSEYNFSFKLPSLDTCDDCDKFEKRLLDAREEIEKENIKKERDAHHHESDNRYKMKEEDKVRSRLENSKERTCSMDLQKCLPTPCLTNAQSFYKLKLWTFNFTICDMTENQFSCMVWNESIGKRGSNEIASCILKWISSLPQDVKEITFWSDNCAGQNRNINLLFFYSWILYKFPHINTINHKYLLKGHTHMEVDVAHSVIEHKRRRTNTMNICNTHDWAQLMRVASRKNPYAVYEMELKDFYQFDSLGKSHNSPFINRKNKEGFRLSEAVFLQFRRESLGTVLYKTNFECETFINIDLKRNKRKALTLPDTIPIISSKPLLISSKKYQHLQDLLEWIPESLRTYYENLLHQEDAVSEESD